MPYARRRDKVHSPIVGQLRDLGFSVADLAGVGKGVPDALIGKHGITLLVEFKTPGESNGKSPTAILQADFARNWKGCPIVRCETLHDVIAAFNQLTIWKHGASHESTGTGTTG